jgi:hypothetical protein
LDNASLRLVIYQATAENNNKMEVTLVGFQFGTDQLIVADSTLLLHRLRFDFYCGNIMENRNKNKTAPAKTLKQTLSWHYTASQWKKSLTYLKQQRNDPTCSVGIND